jgi:dephospho-CoA kinase
VHDVPLLVENGMGAAFALVVVVDAPVEERVRRLAETRGMSEEDAHARIDAQADDTARAAAADVWIDNAGGRDDVEETVDRLWDERVVPFEANARAGRAVPASTEIVPPDPRWAAQARRLADRIASSAGDDVDRVEHVGATAVPDLAAPDLIELLVLVADGRRVDERAVGEALAAAAFPRTGAGHHGGADPARPVDVRVARTSSDEARRVLAARDAAVDDPQRVRDDPDAVRDGLAVP